MQSLADIDPWIALGVVAATMLTDAVYVLYTSSVVHRRDLAAANWGALTYMLSAFAVINFTSNWVYVLFAALGSWIGAYATMKLLHRRPARATAEESVAAAIACNPQPATPPSLPPSPRLAA